MSSFPQTAPAAYPQYAAGAPNPSAQSCTRRLPPRTPSMLRQRRLRTSPQPTVGSAPGNQGQAWHLLSQAANAMAAAAAPAPAASQVPAAQGPVAPTNGGIRMTGPWIAGELYGVVPTGPLTTVPDNAEKWFAITKGRYIGVTNSAAIADGAVSRVSHALRTGYTTQGEAVAAFNKALSMNALNLDLVAVVA
ncbi:hypothetical protein B0H11DRAFT_1912208 [Mycena galericulata]|nr:hypothetical protein B0H11DRAFT_1912208 [Mycena galericulata]